MDAWKRNWKKNMKSLFIIKLLLFVNRWLTSTWTQFKYSVGRIFLRGIIPDSYWNSIIQNKSLKKRLVMLHYIQSNNVLEILLAIDLAYIYQYVLYQQRYIFLGIINIFRIFSTTKRKDEITCLCNLS